MSNENLQPTSVPEMLRTTGDNTAQFMQHVATHIENLEERVKELTERVQQYERDQANVK
jgi:phage host-nuclease inhibitor protein Gam